MQISISILFVVLCLNLQAQKDCAKYNAAMKKGYEYFDKKNLDKALIEFQAAQVAARECGITANKPADELQKVFKALIKQKNDAVRARKEAEKQKAIAESKTKEAIVQRQANQTQLARIYWNSSEAAKKEKNPLTALHFNAEAIEINKNKDLFRNLLVDVEQYLPVARLKLILSHGDDLKSATFSPDGKKILTIGKDDCTVRIWDAETAKQVGSDIVPTRFTPADKLLAVFSPDGTTILTAGTDTAARFWDATTGVETGIPLHYHDTSIGYFNIIDKAIFSQDGRRILTIGQRSVRVWDRATGKRIGQAIKDVDNYQLIAAFSPDGDQILTGSDSTLRLWKTETGEQLGVDMIDKNQGRINNAIFTINGKNILTTSDYKSACLWDAATTRLITSAIKHESGLRSAALSSNGEFIVTASGDDTAGIWYANTGLPTGVVFNNSSDVIEASFSPDGKQVLTTGWDNAALWDAHTGKQLGPALNIGTDVKSAVFSPKQSRFLTANYDGTVHVWEIGSVRPTGPAMRYGNIRSAVYSRDGKQLLTITADQTANLIDLVSGKPLKNDLQTELAVSTATFSPDGKDILTVSTKDNTVCLWDSKTGKRIGKAMQDTTDIESAVFCADGKEILTVTGYTEPRSATPTRRAFTREHYVNLWDVRTGRRATFPKILVETAVASPKESCVLTTSGNMARLFNTHTGKQLGPDMEYNPNSTTANDFALFSPDGKNILTLNDHGFAMMWQTGKGKNPVFVFRHSELILSARYSKNGKYILTTGDDQTARVWDAYTGKPVGPSIKHEDEINSAVFSLNQKEILTSSSDKTVRLWEIISGKQIGASIKHDKEVSNAIFSPDGADILTLTNDDSTGRLWDMPGDLDIPSDLMKLQARVSTGYELNLQTNELQLILPELWYKLEAEYNKKAREHAKICKYPKYNFWRRFNAGDAEKL